jgi:hypothetical protein
VRYLAQVEITLKNSVASMPVYFMACSADIPASIQRVIVCVSAIVDREILYPNSLLSRLRKIFYANFPKTTA